MDVFVFQDCRCLLGRELLKSITGDNHDDGAAQLHACGFVTQASLVLARLIITAVFLLEILLFLNLD